MNMFYRFTGRFSFVIVLALLCLPTQGFAIDEDEIKADVQELEDKVDEAKTDVQDTVDGVQNTIDDVKTDVETVVEDVTDTVDGVKNDLETIQNDIENNPDGVKGVIEDAVNNRVRSEIEQKRIEAEERKLQEKIRERTKGIVGRVKEGNFPLPSPNIANKAKSGDTSNPHDWANGRSESAWRTDWKNDSKTALDTAGNAIAATVSSNFIECFEPRIIQNACPFCGPVNFRIWKGAKSCPKVENSGEIWEYWWPEAEIELNAFGIAAINPVSVGVEELARQELVTNLAKNFAPEVANRLLEQLGIAPETLPNIEYIETPLFAQNAAADLGASTLVSTEAHAYQTKVDEYGISKRPETEAKYKFTAKKVKGFCIPLMPIGMNGYDKVPECFYNNLNEENAESPIKGWTEESGLIDFWRFPERSEFIRSELYEKSRIAPLDQTINEYLQGDSTTEEKLDWLRSETCASYRLTNFPERFMKLGTLFGVKERPFSMDQDPLRFQCYKEAELFPLTGVLTGDYPEHTSAAYLARKAIELISERRDVLVPKGRDPLAFFADWSETPTTGLDKLQFVYPTNSNECFQMNQVSEVSDFFHKMKFTTDKTGSVRIVIWNKRTTCTCPFRGFMNPQLPLPTLVAKGINKAMPFTPALGCQTYMCNPEDGLIDLPDAVDEILGEVNALIDTIASAPADMVRNGVNTLIEESGLIPVDLIEQYQADLEEIEAQLDQGMQIDDTPIAALIDHEKDKLIAAGDISPLLDIEVGNFDDIEKLPGTLGGRVREGRLSADRLRNIYDKETVEALVDTSMQELATRDRITVENTCEKLAAQSGRANELIDKGEDGVEAIRDAPGQIRDGLDQAGDALDDVEDRLNGDDESSESSEPESSESTSSSRAPGEKIDLGELDFSSLIETCGSFMEKSEHLAGSINTVMAELGESGKNTIVETVSMVLPDKQVSAWVASNVEKGDALLGDLEDDLGSASQYIENVTGALDRETNEALEQVNAVIDPITGEVKESLREVGDRFDDKVDELGDAAEDKLGEFIDIESLGEKFDLERFQEFVDNLDPEKLAESLSAQMMGMAEKHIAKLEEKFAEISGELTAIMGPINQAIAAVEQYTQSCVHLPYQFGDEKIGQGDLRTGHGDAKIFGREVGNAIGGLIGNKFPPFAEAAEKAYPFGSDVDFESKE